MCLSPQRWYQEFDLPKEQQKKAVIYDNGSLSVVMENVRDGELERAILERILQSKAFRHWLQSKHSTKMGQISRNGASIALPFERRWVLHFLYKGKINALEALCFFKGQIVDCNTIMKSDLVPLRLCALHQKQKMNMIEITFPDGNIREYKSRDCPYADSGRASSPRHGQGSACGRSGWRNSRLAAAIETNASVKLYKWEDPEGKYAYWHSSAHLMAEALEELYPNIKFGIGPAIEQGFYYDVDPGTATIKEEDLPRIEERMLQLVAKNEPIVRKEISKTDAHDLFEKKKMSTNSNLFGSYLMAPSRFTHKATLPVSLCRGPHLPNTGLIKAVKLLSVAGAYWRG